MKCGNFPYPERLVLELPHWQNLKRFVRQGTVSDMGPRRIRVLKEERNEKADACQIVRRAIDVLISTEFFLFVDDNHRLIIVSCYVRLR
jgi:hypothetical protein